MSNINKILNYHLSYYKKYYSKCLKASRLKNENLKTKLKFIKKNKIGLMNIGRETAIKRVFKEMYYYLKTIKRYNIYK